MPLISPTLSVSARSSAEVTVDALVVVVTQSEEGPALATGHGLPRPAVRHLNEAMAALKVMGRPAEVVTLSGVPGVRATTVVLTGAGRRTGRTMGAEQLRRAIGTATRSLSGRATAAVCVPGAGTVEMVTACAEGAGLGAYAVTGHRGITSPAVPLQAVTLLTATARETAVRRVVKRAGSISVATAWCRDLVNQAPNHLHPESFAEQVRARAKGTGVRVRVLDEAALAQGGYGGLLGVGQGSARPSRLVVVSYAPAKTKRSIALVGKGITFDSGGLSLKPPLSMPAMKSDMAGAAAVVAAILAIAELGLPVAVTGYLALAENMPGGNAQRPGDVVTMRGGRTVEILDTDAEGRMVLADALTLASEKHPDAIIDIATLTGAQVVALGHRVGALMSNDDAFRDLVRAAADQSGEAIWPMPLPDDLRSNLESQVADLAHKGDRMGGMLTAGLFLSEFIGPQQGGGVGSRIPWAHLDIAGPSYNASAAHDYTPKGGTGFGVRTLVRTVENFATA